MMLTSVSASAQFYTITKETAIDSKQTVISTEKTEIKEDTIIVSDSTPMITVKIENEGNLGQKVLNARKSDDYKSRRNDSVFEKKIDLKQQASVLNNKGLPELTITNLLAEIKKNNIKFPKIVLAHAILETGWFKSSVCRNKHNLFGLTNPRTKSYYEFNHWTESVKAYYNKVQYRYPGKGDYLLWLNKTVTPKTRVMSGH